MKTKKFFGFNKNEWIALGLIFASLVMVISYNFSISFRRSRDSRRKNDIRSIHDALIAYQEEVASFPASDDGSIVACFDGVDENGIPQRRACDWGWDGLPNIFEEGMPEYIATLPADPRHTEGRRYVYLSNGRRFQILAALEGSDEAEFDQAIIDRQIMCGDVICNFGRAFDDTPLDKSVEEYENEIRARESAIKEKNDKEAAQQVEQ